jgi:hypothetical protein
MPKKSATKSRPSTGAKKSKSDGIQDLPMKGRHVRGADKVVGGELSLSYGKVQVEYKPQRG